MSEHKLIDAAAESAMDREEEGEGAMEIEPATREGLREGRPAE